MIPSELALAAFLFGLCFGAIGVLLVLGDINRKTGPRW